MINFENIFTGQFDSMRRELERYYHLQTLTTFRLVKLQSYELSSISIRIVSEDTVGLINALETQKTLGN